MYVPNLYIIYGKFALSLSEGLMLIRECNSSSLQLAIVSKGGLATIWPAMSIFSLFFGHILA